MKRILLKSRRARLLVAPAVAILLSACAPTAAIQNLFDGQIVAGSVPIDNEVTTDAAGGPVTATEDVDGGPLTLDANNDAVLNSEDFTNGEHTVTLNASNNDGSASDSATINVQNPPIPGSICLVGDSITFMAFYPHGETDQAPELLSSTFNLGWRVQNVIAWVQEHAAQRDCQTFISALGVNDVSPTNGGFTDQVQQNFTGMWNTPHTQSCKVQVLPFWGEGLTNQAHIDGLTAYRDWALLQDAAREDLVTIDWLPFVQANPWVMDVDGIHLAWADYPQEDGTVWHTTMLEAAQIRQNFYWSESTAACQEFIAQFEAAPELLVTDPEEFALAA